MIKPQQRLSFLMVVLDEKTTRTSQTFISMLDENTTRTSETFNSMFDKNKHTDFIDTITYKTVVLLSQGRRKPLVSM